MKVLKYPVTVVLTFFALGIITDNYLQPTVVIILIATVISAAVLFISYLSSQRKIVQSPYFYFAVSLLSFSLGMLSHWLHYGPNSNLHYSNQITASEIPAITGVITERLKPNDYYEKYLFKVESVNNKSANGTVLLSVPKDTLAAPPEPGDSYIIADVPQPIFKSLNPYQFDYAAYMEKQNVFHQLQLKDNYIKTAKHHNINYYITSLRNSLIGSFNIHAYDTATKNMVNALLFGQRQDMDKETTDNYTKAGVVHILAISGLHFATLFFILNIILKPLKKFTRKGRLGQLLLILGLMWLFAFVTGLSASVVRSVVMFSFVSIGACFNRNSNIYNSIAVSMLVLLIAKPNFLFDVGFQLSYAAVFAIVWLQPLYNRIRKSKYKAVNYITDTVAISLVAQVGVLPLTLYYFNQFPLLFLLANIVVIPLSTFVLILGIVVLMLNFTIPSLAVIAGKLLEWAIRLMNNFIEWIASFDNMVIQDIPFDLLLCLSLTAALFFISKWLYNKNFRHTVTMLGAIIFFQAIYFINALNAKENNELIVFNNRKSTLVAIKQKQQITIYSNDSMAAGNNLVRSYSKEYFNPKLCVLPLNNTIWFNNKKILIIDSTGVYPEKINPDILLLTQSPKLNLERTIRELKPKQVVADATNYKSYTRRWEQTCKLLNINFHSTTTSGYLKVAK